MRLVLSALIACVLAIPCSASPQVNTATASPATKTYKLAGVVVNPVSGEPIRRALVLLQGPTQYSAFTGQDGRFEIENVPEGSYVPTVQKPRFFQPNMLDPQNVRVNQISVSASAKPVTLELVPAATITGRVTDSNGQPVQNASVQCFSEQVINGRKRWQPGNAAVTDEDGTYEIENLAPGQYKIRLLQGHPSDFTGVASVAARLPQRAYRTQYFPDASDAQSAQSFQLRPGERMQADFKVTPVPAFRVSGSAGPIATFAFGNIQDVGGDDVGNGIAVNPQTGKWTASALPSGTWKIVVHTQGPSGESPYYGERSVEVADSDVQNVAVPLQPLASVPVRIANSTESTAQNVQIRLMPHGFRPNDPEYGASASASQGSASITGVLPGTYSVVAQSWGEGCVDSISSGGIDLTRDDLTVALGSQPAPIDVVLRTDCATLNVNLTRSDEAAPVAVVVVSGNRSFEPRLINFNGSNAKIPNLTPGDYRIFAFSSAAGLEYANPEALRDYTGQEITLAPNQQVEVSINIIERGGN